MLNDTNARLVAINVNKGEFYNKPFNFVGVNLVIQVPDVLRESWCRSYVHSSECVHTLSVPGFK